jgi:two-component system chemotaxis response regulator CheB
VYLKRLGEICLLELKDYARAAAAFEPLRNHLNETIRDAALEALDQAYTQLKEPKALASVLNDRALVSTGGPRALEVVLGKLGANGPGTVIVQHMPEGFTRAFADRLNSLFPMQVREAQDGEMIVSGTVLIAPGRSHLFVQRSGAGYVARLREAPPVNHHRPSVDVMLHSVAKAAGANAVGVILTGMGRDGAEGLLAMRDAGAYTIAQDEQSSVVYGMPREAAALGAAVDIVAIEDVARCVRAHLNQPSPSSAVG